jgi:Tol biopolymer transport system component
MAAVVDEPLIVRSTPGTADSASTTGDRLWKGERVRLLEGPIEADGYPWWHVRIGEIEGWIASEEKDGSAPWIAPISNGEILYVTADQELRIVEPESGENRPFLSQPLESFRPVISCGYMVDGSWSADGSFAIITDTPTCNGVIYRVAADGRSGVRLTAGNDPALSGDDGKVAFGQPSDYSPCGLCGTAPTQAWDIMTIAADGSAKTGSTWTSSAHGFVAWHPSWSPDRRSMAYGGYRLQDTKTDGSVEVGVFITDASGTRRLTDGSRPTWSPDGRWIVFERTQQDGSPSKLFRIRPDGRDEQPLGLGDAGSVAFSPDGSQLAVTAWTDWEHRFVSVTAFGHDVVSGAITDRGSDPIWSPDGEWLSWTLPDAAGVPKLWVGRPDGSNSRPIADGIPLSWRPLLGN